MTRRIDVASEGARCERRRGCSPFRCSLLALIRQSRLYRQETMTMTDEALAWRQQQRWPRWMSNAPWNGGLAAPLPLNDPARDLDGPVWVDTPSGGLLALHPSGANWEETASGGSKPAIRAMPTCSPAAAGFGASTAI